MKAFCCSVNVHGVVVPFTGGGNTIPLYIIIKLFLVKGGRNPKT